MSSLPSILFVACDSHLASIYAKKFDVDGWEVEIAESLDEGEKKATRSRPDVILLSSDCAADVSIEVKKLRKMPTIQKSKIVILASLGDREEIQSSMKAGASSYIILGHFVPQELVKKVRAVLGK